MFDFSGLNLFLFKILFIYLTRDRAHTQTGAREGEAGSPLSRETNAGLDPGTLGQ